MKFSLFSKTTKEELAIVYDIGSASVGGALVLLSHNAHAKIIYSVRKEMLFQEELNFTRFTSSMLDTIKKVSLDLQKNGLAHLKFTKLGNASPSNIYCTLSSPWYASQTHFFSLKSKEFFTASEEKINTLIDEEIRKIKSNTKTNFDGSDEKNTIIERRIMQIKLNGYETERPFGKKINNMEFSALLSFAPKKLLQDIESAVGSVFSVSQNMHFNSFPFVAFDTLRDVLIKERNFLFLDVSGELTDVSLVKNDVLVETTSFPMGKNNIIRDIKNKLRVSADEAASLILMHKNSSLEVSQKKRIQTALSEIEQKWMGFFQKTLVDLSESFAIPSTVFFTTDRNMEKFFIDVIKKEQFSQFVMADNTFTVLPLNAAFLSASCSFYQNAKRDPFLMLGALFADKLEKNRTV